MKFKELYEKVITERFADLHVKKGKVKKLSPADLNKDRELADELFNLIDITYASIGGHLKIRSADDVPGNNDEWDAVDIDSDPDADIVFASKIKNGNKKITTTATDSSKEASKKMLEILVKTLSKPGNVIEVSDALAHVLLTRYKVSVVSDENDVKNILKGKDINWVGEHPDGKYPGTDGWYERQIGPKKKLKIMVGVAK
jgi:hypothetical protein